MTFRSYGLLTLLMIFALDAAAARTPKLYSFDATNTWLAAAEELPNWHTTLERHESQLRKIYDCKTHNTCRGRVRSYLRLHSAGMELSEVEKIELVHRYINRAEYAEDRPKRKYDADGKRIGWQRNHWTTLYEFLRGSGDCEDYAAAKYFMLRQLGISAHDMRVVVTYNRKLHGTHAVLAVRRPDGAVWLLDSDNRIRKTHHREFRFIYAVNEHGVWDHDTKRKP